MQENLPPPNWSPTGNSGYWVWHEKRSKIKMENIKLPATLTSAKEEKGCWKWFDDVYGYETPAQHKYKSQIGCGSSRKKQSWIDKIKGLIKRK